MPLAWTLLLMRLKCNFLTLPIPFARDNNPLCLLLIKANSPTHNRHLRDFSFPQCKELIDSQMIMVFTLGSQTSCIQSLVHLKPSSLVTIKWPKHLHCRWRLSQGPQVSVPKCLTGSLGDCWFPCCCCQLHFAQPGRHHWNVHGITCAIHSSAILQ